MDFSQCSTLGPWEIGLGKKFFCGDALTNLRDRSANDAKKAVQFVLLVGYDNNTAFAPQIETLQLLDTITCKLLRRDPLDIQRSNEVINLRQHVLTKVSMASLRGRQLTVRRSN